VLRSYLATPIRPITGNATFSSFHLGSIIFKSFSWAEYDGREHITLGEMSIGLLEHAYVANFTDLMFDDNSITQVRFKDVDQIQLFDLDPKARCGILTFPIAVT
jgi:hypothetical protein